MARVASDFPSYRFHLISLFRSLTPQQQGVLLGALGAVLFSHKAIVIKLSYLYSASPEVLLALRMLLAFPFFMLTLRWFERTPAPRMSAQDWLQVAFLGAVGYYAASYLDFLGLQTISVGLGRVILYLNPAIVLILSALFLGKRISRSQFAAMLVAYLGVVLVFWHDVSLSGDGLLIGAVFTLGSAFSYALYLVMAGEMVQRMGSIRLVTYASTASAICCLIQALLVEPSALFSQPWQVYGLSLVNATLCTVAPMVAVMMSIDRVGSTAAAQAGAVGPVATLFLGWLILSEPISSLQLLGTAVVIAGIWMLMKLSGARA
ncbi:MAG: hypothetical protein RL320_542 [Pseudomonadota bacterium]